MPRNCSKEFNSTIQIGSSTFSEDATTHGKKRSITIYTDTPTILQQKSRRGVATLGAVSREDRHFQEVRSCTTSEETMCLAYREGMTAVCDDTV